MNEEKYGIYVHIPFCPHICPYCDFIKTDRFSSRMVKHYFSLLEKQADALFSEFLEKRSVAKERATVYWGGGTPGLFKSSLYLPLMEFFKSWFHLTEVTLETNPWTNAQTLFGGYKDIGINRLTLGAQSLCEKMLGVLGRRHTPQSVLENLQWAQRAGFSSIQVDLIYGLEPGVRTVCVRDEVLRLLDAGATGISAYALTIEPRTHFAHAQAHLAHEDNARREYDEILEVCARQGLRQFETSNFAFSAPRHNQIYWYGKPYFGLGTGAHGLLPATTEWPYGRRYRVGQTLKTLAPGNDDFADLKNNDLASSTLFDVLFDPPRTRHDFVTETIFTRLRTEEGLPWQWFQDVLNVSDPLTIFSGDAKISRAFQAGHLTSDTHLRLSPQGKVLGDAWVVDLLHVLEKEGFLDG